MNIRHVVIDPAKLTLKPIINGEWPTREGLASHNGAWKTNMTVDTEAGLITILMVQSAGWRNEEEGKKIEPAFRKAALAAFSTPAAPSRNR